MCSSSANTEKNSCCTSLCLKRRKESAVRSWYYAPSGTITIPDIDADLNLLNYTIDNNFQYIDSDCSPVPEQEDPEIYQTATVTTNHHRSVTQFHRRQQVDTEVNVAAIDESNPLLLKVKDVVDARLVSPSPDTATASTAAATANHKNNAAVTISDKSCSSVGTIAKTPIIVNSNENSKLSKGKKHKGQKLRFSKQLCKHRQDAVRPKDELSTISALNVTTSEAKKRSKTNTFTRSKNDGIRWLNGRRSKATPLMGTVTVRLRRIPGQNLGLGIAGGSDRCYQPTISYLRPGYVAHRCDQLQIGEHLTHVNNISVEDLTHDEVLSVLRNAGNEVCLRVEYDLNQSYFQWPPNTMRKCTEIVLERDQDGFGLTLRGGAYGPDKNKSRPITITNIRIDGPAHKEGRLRVGDRILCINGVDVFSATLSTAQKLIDEAIHLVTLTVEYSVAVFENLHKESGPLIVELEKRPEVDFGMKLKCETEMSGNDGGVSAFKRLVLVDTIVPASTADRCGFLQVGDQIISLDGVCLSNISLQQAIDILKSSNSSLRIELLPSSEFRNSKYDMKKNRGLLASIESKPILSEFTRTDSFGLQKLASESAAVAAQRHRNTVLERATTAQKYHRSVAQPRSKSHDRGLQQQQQQQDLIDSRLDYRINDCGQRQKHAAVNGSVPNMKQLLPDRIPDCSRSANDENTRLPTAMCKSYCRSKVDDDADDDDAVNNSCSRLSSPIRSSYKTGK
uniref:PDZ domain-containing protein n=1 Tax=Syphacia muris TaxID=451379 RepID=A0A158R522_9BILA